MLQGWRAPFPPWLILGWLGPAPSPAVAVVPRGRAAAAQPRDPHSLGFCGFALLSPGFGGHPPPRQGLLTATCPDDALPVPAVPPSVLLDEIEAAELEGNDGRIEGVLCGAVKQLKATRAKPDGALYLSLMYLAKIKPNIFATEGVIEVRAGWLE